MRLADKFLVRSAKIELHHACTLNTITEAISRHAELKSFDTRWCSYGRGMQLKEYCSSIAVRVVPEDKGCVELLHGDELPKLRIIARIRFINGAVRLGINKTQKR